MKLSLVIIAALALLPNSSPAQTAATSSWRPLSSLNNFNIEYHPGLTTYRTTTDYSTVLRLKSNPPVRLGRFLATSEQVHASAACSRGLYTVEERVTMSQDGEIRILANTPTPTRLSTNSTDWIVRALVQLCRSRTR